MQSINKNINLKKVFVLPFIACVLGVTSQAKADVYSQQEAPKKELGLNLSLSYDQALTSGIQNTQYSQLEVKKGLPKIDYRAMRGGTFTLKKEYSLLGPVSLATSLSYSYGSTGNNHSAVTLSEAGGDSSRYSLDSELRKHVLRVGELVQYNIETSAGVFRPTIGIEIAYGLLKENTVFGMNQDEEGLEVITDITGMGLGYGAHIGADFKLNNGITPFFMFGQDSMNIKKIGASISFSKNMEEDFNEDVKRIVKESIAKRSFDLSNRYVKVGVGYTF